MIDLDGVQHARVGYPGHDKEICIFRSLRYRIGLFCLALEFCIGVTASNIGLLKGIAVVP